MFMVNKDYQIDFAALFAKRLLLSFTQPRYAQSNRTPSTVCDISRWTQWPIQTCMERMGQTPLDFFLNLDHGNNDAH